MEMEMFLSLFRRKLITKILSLIMNNASKTHNKLLLKTFKMEIELLKTIVMMLLLYSFQNHFVKKLFLTINKLPVNLVK
jgi:hypothetical protein